MRSCLLDTLPANSRRYEKNASPASPGPGGAVAVRASSSSLVKTMASKSASLLGKWRYRVPTPTPARSATASMGAATPRTANTSSAASRIRCRFFTASARMGRPAVTGTGRIRPAGRPLEHIHVFHRIPLCRRSPGTGDRRPGSA